MVSYQRWTQILFEVASEKGAETSQKNSQRLISQGAQIWNENKEQLSAATVGEARGAARRMVVVR